MGTPEQIRRMVKPIEAYLKTHSDDLRVREVYAVLLSLENRYAESLAEFAKVPVEKRRHDANWVWFKTLMNSGAKGEAMNWIKTAWPTYSQEVRSADFSAYIKFLWDVSACLSGAGEYAEAEAGYRTILESDPGAQGVYLEYGQLLARLNGPKEAVEILRQGLQLTSKEIDNQYAYPSVIG